MADADAQDETLSQLSALIEQITQKQGSISLHAKYVQLALDAGLDEQANAGRELMTMFVAAPAERVWLPFLASKEQELADNMDGVKEIHELYLRAAQDYLSIPLLVKHMDFIIQHQDLLALASVGEDDDEIATTRQSLITIVDKGASHLSQGHELWDRLRDWEVQLLENDKSSEQVERVDNMYMARLQVPHSTHETTSQAYSTFTSTYFPPEDYEKRMIAATKARGAAVKAWNVRESSEIMLKNAGYSLDAYASYVKEDIKRLASTRKLEAPRKGRKAPARNVQDETIAQTLLHGLYERAISAAADALFANPTDVAAERHLREFWIGLTSNHKTGIEPRMELATLYRATRSVPASGDVWARYLRAAERHADIDGPKEPVAAAFNRALECGVIQDTVDDLVTLVQARADFERHCLEAAPDEGAADGLLSTLDGGIKLVRDSNKDGDPRLRLEKYLSALYEDMDDTESVVELWEATTKVHKTSYLAWLEYLRILSKSDVPKARTIYRDVAAKFLDWPEMLWDAWLQFEHLHGSVDDLEDCVSRVRAASEKLAARRAKEAEAYQSQYASAAVAAEVVAPSGEQPTQQQQEEEMRVDEPESNGTKKRKIEDDDGPVGGEANKRVKIDDSVLKRDRENSTVIVSNLEAGTEELSLRKLFRDCGEVREVKIVTLSSGPVATVEFVAKDSVPAALTRDKKRIAGHEVSVHLGWKSTLWVTNFPESLDDAAMRKLFEEYGTLLDVRWPSKKFKSSRRFCYVQFTTPAAAEAALSLHGQELAPGMSLSVLISDPSRKKDRTDADANEREIYIAGLSRFTGRDDLRSLFQQFGPIKDVRMALDDKGHSKGFAFVEFAEARSAQSALTANNYELKSRRIAVTLADPRVRAKHKHDSTGLGRKASVISRSVRLRGLPTGTQEGLLQQLLEKELGGVKRVEVFMDLCEAVVEFETQQTVGTLLLRGTPIVFQGKELTVVEEASVQQASKAKTTATSTPSSASTPTAAAPAYFVPRGVASRPRAGIGSKKRVGPTAVVAGAGVVSKADVSMETSADVAPAQSGSGKDQDDFRKMLGQ